jgi:fibronectin type 3 domain-containing protein
LNDDIAPVVPTGANSTASTSGALQVNFSWTATKTQDGSGTQYPVGDANYDVASYKIYRALHSGAYTQVATVTQPATTYTDATGLTKCTVYDYKVTAVDQCGNESAIGSSSAVYGDANLSGGISDAPTNNTTNTRPTDSSAPARSHRIHGYCRRRRSRD